MSDVTQERWLPFQWVFRTLFRMCWRLFTRVHFVNADRVPKTGPFIIAINHLHLFDATLALCTFTRPMAHIMHTNWSFWFVARVYDAIYVPPQQDQTQTGERAMRVLQAMSRLRSGRGILIAPEGRRSSTGGLARGRPGVVGLATSTGVPIIPVAIYGLTDLVAGWMRFRRPDIYVRVGEPITLPRGVASDEQLQDYTDHIMMQIAALLPPEYRGVYGETWPVQMDGEDS